MVRGENGVELSWLWSNFVFSALFCTSQRQWIWKSSMVFKALGAIPYHPSLLLLVGIIRQIDRLILLLPVSQSSKEVSVLLRSPKYLGILQSTWFYATKICKRFSTFERKIFCSLPDFFTTKLAKLFQVPLVSPSLILNSIQLSVLLLNLKPKPKIYFDDIVFEKITWDFSIFSTSWILTNYLYKLSYGSNSKSSNFNRSFYIS